MTKMSDATLAIKQAIYDGDFEGLRAAIASGGDLAYISESDNWNHLTGMLNAAAKDLSVEMIQYLIDAGNDVNLVDQFGNTSVMYAVRAKRADILEVLLKAGAQFEYFNMDQESPLQMATAFIDNEYACAKLLFEAGADATVENSFGYNVKAHMETRIDTNDALRAIYDTYLGGDPVHQTGSCSR